MAASYPLHLGGGYEAIVGFQLLSSRRSTANEMTVDRYDRRCDRRPQTSAARSVFVVYDFFI